MRLEDVAKRAKVSIATVSRVVNSVGPVKNSTRARVLKAITELKYHPNIHARSLAGGKSRTLGMIVSNLENPFFLDIFRALESDAHRRGYEVLVANTDYRARQLVSSVHLMMGRRLAGLAVIVSEMEPSLIQELTESNLPIVFYDVGTPARNISNIKVRYEKGMQRVVEYLYSVGHRRMAFVGHHISLEPLLDRKKSFLDTMKRYAGEVEHATVADCDGPVGGQQATRQLLASGFKPTAIICVNDFMALGVVRELREHGLEVPRDVSVTGYDNISLSEYAFPPLTTVNIPREMIGHLAFSALVPEHEDAQVRGREFLIDPELVIRESTGPPPKN
ncbi:MAG: LacI family transcriptional regulator [Acidobacteriia bacterium]|nr:LacI family transcriptional regulator [Terriglobia bacterium]